MMRRETGGIFDDDIAGPRGARALIIAPLTRAGRKDWPSRPVQFIVPYPPGGSTDVGARVIADYLSRVLGQQIVVENKSGASGNIGIEAAAKSAADGYTVLVAPDQVTSAPHVFKMNFDPLKDLVPVIQLSRQPVVLAVHPSLGVELACRIDRAGERAAGDELCDVGRGLAAADGGASGSRRSPASSSSTCPIAAAGRRSTT